MRITSLALSVLILASVSHRSEADEWKSILYLPSKNGEKPQTRNTDTGVAMVVRQAELGSPPKDCPVSAFWALNDKTLVDCNSGEQFQLIETDASKQVGAFELAPKPVPLPVDDPKKTDKPGPMKADPKSGDDSKVIQ